MARRLLHALVIVLTLLVGAAAVAIIVSQTVWFKDWLRGYIVREANQYLNGELTIGRLGGNLFFGVELEDIGVTMDGTEVVAVKDLGLDYNVFEMIARGMSVDDIRLNQPVLYLRREGDAWSITRLIKQQQQEADREGPAVPITIESIGISDATIVLEGADSAPAVVGTTGEAEGVAVNVPDRIERLDARLSFRYEPVRYTIEISHVSFRADDPTIGLNSLSGVVAVRDDTVFLEDISVRTEESSIAIDGAVEQYLATPVFNVTVSSDKLSVPEIARAVPALAGVDLQPAFELSTSGPLDRLSIGFNVRSSAGQVSGELMADVQAPRLAVAGDVSVRHLDLAPLLKDPAQKSDLTADAQLDLRANDLSDLNTLSGTVALNAPRLAASGYAAENVKGTARLNGRRVNIDARASAYGTNVTTRGRLTLPEGREPLSYDLRGEVRGLDLRRLPAALEVPPASTGLTAEYHVRGAETSARTLDADLQFGASAVAGARIAAGSRAAVRMRGEDVAYRLDMTVADADLQRIGQEFNVAALAEERYASTLNAHVVAEGEGTDPALLTLNATGEVTNSSVLGGDVPQLAFAADVAQDTARIKAAGRFSGFDPAAISGRPELKGTVGGSIDVDATISDVSAGVGPSNAEGTIRLALDPSDVGGLAIERAAIDADYRDRAGEIRQLEIVGRDLNVEASGTLALNDTGRSNLTFHADSPSLTEIGTLFDVPVEGIAKIDGTVTGNRTDLHATGTLVGNGVVYQENGALSLTTNYDVRLPDLDADWATVSAETDATFVTVAGQNINELSAKTTYAGSQVEFQVMATQPERSLQAGGTVTLHPDHQEIHLQSLALSAQQVQWGLAPGTEATVNYAGSGVAVRGLQLVSGAQQITADGALGGPGDALDIRLNGVDLSTVDALLLREPQLSGRLDATATITGTADQPQVRGEFQVSQGTFRQFKYDTFGGTIGYTDRTVSADVRLQQNPAQWITAKGTVPVALFRGGAPDAAAAGSASAIDFAVDSSPIDLGLVQGFTTALTDVTGTLEAHVRVTGPADAPQPQGTIAVQNGGLTVVPTGVPYNNITANIALAGDRVQVTEITLLDDDYSWLSLTGELAIDQKRLQNVQLYMNAEDFEVLDNDLGDVHIESALEIVGDITAPRIGGYLGVNSGEINLDRAIALAGSSPYATEEIEYEEGQAEEASAGGPIDALTMEVNLIVSNDLLVEADSLQPPGSTFSLGALNLTLGGDIQVRKEAGAPVRLVGPITTVRGTYDFQGRRFEILRDGSIRFEGLPLDELNPRLDIRTRREIRAVEARVNIRGTMREPEIVLSSTPPLDDADILSLIVFNQPLNELGTGQQASLAQRAQALATGAVVGQLTESIGNALNLDTFEISLAPESGTGAEVTFGEQLGDALYVRVQQGVGNQSTTNFILEYELTEWLRLQTNVVQGSSTQPSIFRRAQGTGADLIFFFSY